MIPLSRSSANYLRGFYLILLVFSQALAAPPEKLELIQADKIRSFTRNGLTYRRLVGHVKLRRKAAILTCDLAEFQVEQDKALLSGKVVITTPDSRLSSRSASYYGEQQYVELTGNARFENGPFLVTAQKLGYLIDQKQVLATDNPVLIDSGSTLTADTIYYYENSQLGDAWGQGLLTNLTDSLSVAGDHLLYYSGRDSLLSYGRAIFTKWSATDTTLKIESDSLSLDEGFFFAWENVKLINGESQGICEQAVYMQDDDVVVMKGAPELKKDDFQLTGKLFNLHLDHGDLQSVYVPEQPHFAQTKLLQDSSYTDWLDGQVMAVEFQAGQPHTVTLVGMATSYFNVIEEGLFKGTNTVSGDTLFIILSDSSISDITVSGGAEGDYQPAHASQDLEYPIAYQADLIAYNMQNQTTLLQHAAKIKYGDMTMEAGQVGVYWRQNLLRARSMTDTLGATDYPVLKQTGQEDFHGATMAYDLQSQRGKVAAGRTKLDEGNYFGKEVTRVNQDVYLMSEGYYTTCSLEEHPHFYFYSKQMKLLTDKIIIAKPVVLYIADIPLFALPFAVFPQKRDRSSGFILPSYDYRPNNGGRALKGFGYYWAINDYSDFKMTGDFWDQYEEFKLRSVLRYKKRYRINGRLDASMASKRVALDDPATWGWKLSFSHNQTIDPSFSIRANANLSGDANFDRTYSQNQNSRLNTRLHSGISVNKKLTSIKSSLSLNGTYDQNLQVTRRIAVAPAAANIKLSGPSLAWPSFRFSRSSSALIPAQGNEEHWYNNFRWGYGNTFSNKRKWSYLSYENPDSLSADTLLWQTEVTNSRSWNHNLSLSGNTQLAQVLKLVGSVNYQDKWGFRYLDPILNDQHQVLIDTASGALQTQEIEGFIRRGTFNTNLSLNTKLYGLFPVHLGPLQAIRHTLTPSLSLRYTPNFATPFWGYTRALSDSSGVSHTFDRFAGSDLGATPSRDALSLNYSLNNVFDYKLFSHDTEMKGQFFTWSLGGSYNFKADSLKASDISNNFKISLGKNFKLSPRATFELYERDSTGTHKIDQFRAPRMTRASFSFGFRLQGAGPGGRHTIAKESVIVDSSATATPGGFVLDEPTSGGLAAWTANFSFSYTYSHQNPLLDPKQTFSLNTALKFNFSENWAVTYNPRFNLIERKLVSGSIGVTRDLHCWNMTINWTPMGRWGGINILIRPKARQLQDLKLEHTSHRRY